jgi:hypothetical protein
VFWVEYKHNFKFHCIQFYNIKFWYIKFRRPTIKHPILWAKNIIHHFEETKWIRSVPEGDSEKHKLISDKASKEVWNTLQNEQILNLFLTS